MEAGLQKRNKARNIPSLTQIITSIILEQKSPSFLYFRPFSLVSGHFPQFQTKNTIFLQKFSISSENFSMAKDGIFWTKNV